MHATSLNVMPKPFSSLASCLEFRFVDRLEKGTFKQGDRAWSYIQAKLIYRKENCATWSQLVGNTTYVCVRTYVFMKKQQKKKNTTDSN